MGITLPNRDAVWCAEYEKGKHINDEVVMDQMIDEIYDVLPIHERIIKYEDKEKMQVGDKILTPEERKKQKEYCTAVMVANIVGIFILACVFNWILLLIFD